MVIEVKSNPSAWRVIEMLRLLQTQLMRHMNGPNHVGNANAVVNLALFYIGGLLIISMGGSLCHAFHGLYQKLIVIFFDPHQDLTAPINLIHTRRLGRMRCENVFYFVTIFDRS